MSLEGMWPSVILAWPIMCQEYEGVTYWMYLDTKSKVTTGTGNLIDSVKAAQAIEWVTLTGDIATDLEIETEWKRVKAMTQYSKLNGFDKVWTSSAQLLITRPTTDRLLLETSEVFWDRLLETLPALGSFPADGQLSTMDEAWQNGPGYLDLFDSKTKDYTWKGTRAALLAQDFDAAALHVPGSGDRAERRRNLFMNAADVVQLGLDRSRLWDSEQPKVEGDQPIGPPDENYKPSTDGKLNMHDVYFGNDTDQKLKPGDNELKLNAKGDTSIVVGPNQGVDVVAGLWFNKTPPEGTGVFFRIVDYKAKDSKVEHNRLSITPKKGDQVSFKGALKDHKVAGRDYRLRLIVHVPEGVTDLVVGYYQVSGWKM